MAHRGVGARAGIALLAASLATPGTGSAQQRFRVGVEVVHIQVSVADGSGRFVRDLTSEDFELRIDGEPREIVTAYAIDSDAPDESWLDPTFDASATMAADVRALEGPPPAARRRFLVFVDLARLSIASLRNTRRASERFIAEHVRPADLLAVVVFSPRRGLDYLVPFTTDHAQVADAIDSIGSFRASERIADAGDGIPLDAVVAFYTDVDASAAATETGTTSQSDGSPGGGDPWSPAEVGSLAEFIAEIDEARFESAAESMISAMRDLTESLVSTEGRKHVLMFSQGLPDSFLVDPAFEDALDEFASVARRADVVFHTFDPSNVGVSSVGDLREQESNWQPGSARGAWGPPASFVIRDRGVMHFVADETGGEASFWRWAMNEGLERVERETNDYYVLAFPLRDDDGDTIAIEVTTRRPEVEVTWAPGELTVGGRMETRSEFQRNFEVAAALELGASKNDLGARVRAWMLPPDGRERARVAVATQIDGTVLETLRDERSDAHVDFEILGMTVSHDRRVLDYFRGSARADLGGIASGEPLPPFRFSSWLRIPPGRHFVKVLVREAASGRLFSRSMAVDVPAEPATILTVDAPLVVLPPNIAPTLRGRPHSSAPDEDAGNEETPPEPDPFAVNAMPVSIDLSETLTAGDDLALMTTVHAVRPHPDTGRPRVSITAQLARPDGTRVPLRPLSILRAEWQPETGALPVIVRTQLPEGLEAGSYLLVVQASDAVGLADASAAIEVVILDR